MGPCLEGMGWLPVLWASKDVRLRRSEKLSLGKSLELPTAVKEPLPTEQEQEKDPECFPGIGGDGRKEHSLHEALNAKPEPRASARWDTAHSPSATPGGWDWGHLGCGRVQDTLVGAARAFGCNSTWPLQLSSSCWRRSTTLNQSSPLGLGEQKVGVLVIQDTGRTGFLVEPCGEDGRESPLPHTPPSNLHKPLRVVLKRHWDVPLFCCRLGPGLHHHTSPGAPSRESHAAPPNCS